MNFEPQTKGGYDCKVLEKVEGYLIGYVIEDLVPIPVRWNPNGTNITQDDWSLIPKKRSIWVHNDRIRHKQVENNIIFYEEPAAEGYIEFRQV